MLYQGCGEPRRCIRDCFINWNNQDAARNRHNNKQQDNKHISPSRTRSCSMHNTTTHPNSECFAEQKVQHAPSGHNGSGSQSARGTIIHDRDPQRRRSFGTNSSRGTVRAQDTPDCDHNGLVVHQHDERRITKHCCVTGELFKANNSRRKYCTL